MKVKEYIIKQFYDRQFWENNHIIELEGYGSHYVNDKGKRIGANEFSSLSKKDMNKRVNRIIEKVLKGESK